MATIKVCDYCGEPAIDIRRRGVTTREGRRVLISVLIETDEGEAKAKVAELCLYHHLTSVLDGLDPTWRERTMKYAEEAAQQILLQPVEGERQH